MKQVTKEECLKLGFYKVESTEDCDEEQHDNDTYEYSLNNVGRLLIVDFYNEYISLYIEDVSPRSIVELNKFTDESPLTLDLLKTFIKSFGSPGRSSDPSILQEAKDKLKEVLMKIYCIGRTRIESFDEIVKQDFELKDEAEEDIYRSGLWVIHNYNGYRLWENLVEIISKKVFKVLYKKTLDKYDTLDVSQDEFIKLSVEAERYCEMILAHTQSNGEEIEVIKSIKPYLGRLSGLEAFHSDYALEEIMYNLQHEVLKLLPSMKYILHHTEKCLENNIDKWDELIDFSKMFRDMLDKMLTIETLWKKRKGKGILTDLFDSSFFTDISPIEDDEEEEQEN